MALPSPTPTPSISTPPPWSSQPSPPVTMPLAAPLAPPQYPPLPPCPSLSDSPVSSHTRSHTAPNLTPAPLLPLRQVASPEGLTHVHVPFSFQDLAHIKQRLGSYSANPSNYIKNFTQLSRSYALTWQDVFVILGSTTTPEEKKGHLGRSKTGSRPETSSQPSRPCPATWSGCYSRRRPRLGLSGGTERKSQHSAHGRMPIGGNGDHLLQGNKPT